MPNSSGSAPPAPSGPDAQSSGPTGIPPLDELNDHLGRGDFSGAMRAVFPRIMIDVQRAYNLTFPPHWTARDVLAHGLRGDMGRLPDLLFQLYSIYEPVRYGEERDWVRSDPREIVRRIYTETGLRSILGRPADPEYSEFRPTFSVVRPGRESGPATKGGGPW